MIMKYEDRIKLYSSYFDANDKLTPKAILEIFQDIAASHAEQIGVGFQLMLNKNLYWVLSRVKFDILKNPKPNQTIKAITWPHEKGRIDFDRDMLILNEDDEILIKATSKWCVIDTINRKLQRTENVNYIGDICPDINYLEKFDKISLPTSEFKNINAHKVCFSDLDHNKHMNNTNYGTLILNSIDNKNISHFEINFINESVLDDEITISQCKTDNGEYILGKNQDKIIFTAYVK